MIILCCPRNCLPRQMSATPVRQKAFSSPQREREREREMFTKMKSMESFWPFSCLPLSYWSPPFAQIISGSNNKSRLLYLLCTSLMFEGRLPVTIGSCILLQSNPSFPPPSGQINFGDFSPSKENFLPSSPSIEVKYTPNYSSPQGALLCKFDPPN